MALRNLFRVKEPARGPIAPPKPPPPIPTAGPDPLGLPDFLARLRIGDRSALTRADVERAAKRLGLPAQILETAVRVLRTASPAFSENGLPTIRFEPHVFSALTGRRYDSSNPDISYPVLDERKYPGDQDLRWRQLAKAFILDRDAGLQATSWGAFQTLGANYEACGFPSAAAFAAGVAGSQARQLEAFETFLQNCELTPLLKARKWRAFAKAYDGGPQAERLARRLDDAYKAIRKGL